MKRGADTVTFHQWQFAPAVLQAVGVVRKPNPNATYLT